MTCLPVVDNRHFACHAKELDPSTIKGDHARSGSDTMATIEYDKVKHNNVPFERVLEYIRENIASIQHVACTETLDTDSVKALCDLFLQNPAHTNLKSLSLAKNSLNERAAEALAKLLYANMTIESLDLRENKLGPKGATILVQPLVSVNNTLLSLNLSANDLRGVNGASSVATCLEYTTSLHTLKLGHNLLGTQGIKVLAPKLGACRSLRTLALPANELKSKGINLLATELQKRGSCLTYLDIRQNQAQLKGTRGLMSWLNENTTLETLVMDFNDIGAPGAAAMSSVFKFNHTLRHLHRGGHKVGDEGALALAEALQEARHSRVNGNGVSNGRAQALSAGVQESRYLQTLCLDWNQISDQGARALSETLMHNSSLVHLDLSGNQIGDEGGVALAKALPYNLVLRQLHVTNNEMKDATAIAFADSLVGVNRGFEMLSYTRNRMSDRGLDRLKNAFRYRQNFRVWFEGILQSTLTTLDLSMKSIGDEEVIAIANKHRDASSPLQALYIGGELITERGISQFAKKYLAETEACHLTRLYINNCRIGNEGMVTIAQALKTNRSLLVLSLTSSGITATGAEALGKSLEENSTLQRITLDGNNIGIQGLTGLVNVLEHSSTVTCLSVANCGIADEGIGIIATCRLKEVNLSDNNITDVGARNIARSLPEDCPFERLDLLGNKITARGGKALEGFLPSETSFEY